MKRYLKNKKENSDRFFGKLYNAFITIGLTLAMLWGLQAYSTSGSLKFVQLSDVHFLENGTNTAYKMTGETPKLLDDAINQINEQKDVDFVMITGDLIDKPFEKELGAVLPYLEKLNYPWYFAFGNHDNRHFRPQTFYLLQRFQT
jgi:predicted MPP superfamily phosphohydrolase